MYESPEATLGPYSTWVTVVAHTVAVGQLGAVASGLTIKQRAGLNRKRLLIGPQGKQGCTL